MTPTPAAVAAWAVLTASLPALTLTAGSVWAAPLIGPVAVAALVTVREAYGRETVARAVLAGAGVAWLLTPDVDQALVGGYLLAQLIALGVWSAARARLLQPGGYRPAGARTLPHGSPTDYH